MDNAGNLFGSSTSLDITQAWQIIEDTVGLNNTDDYYSFTNSSRSNFSLALNDLSANVDVLLLDDNGSEIANSSADGIANENINKTLGIGTYHIQVHQVDDAITSYNLAVKNNYIPQLQFDTELIKDGIKLTDTKIFDADGAGDIQKVDFWLKKQGSYWRKLDTVSDFSSNSDGSIGFNYDISNLEEGKYYIWGRVTDNSGARSNGWGQAIDVEKIVNPELENVAPTKLDFTIEAKSGGIELKNANVYDANGIDDLTRVDFQLRQENGEWIDIQDALNFTDNGDGEFGFEYSINTLEQGNYELKATAYDEAGAASETLKSYFRVKNTAPSDLRFEVEVVERGVRLKDTRVLDANGANDLSRVDFWLKKQGENWQNIEDAVEFRRNEDGSIGFDYSIESLEQGNYILWARTRDKADSYSNSWQQSFNIGNAAPSQLDFNFKQIDGGVELINTKLFDADGIGDLERIEFELRQEDGEWIEIQDALNFNQNQDGSISFDYSINSLQRGDYQLRATAYDKAGASGDALTTYFKVNNAAPTDLQFDIEAIEDGVRVTNTKVFDANGIDDLSRVDFWLKKEGGNWQNIQDAVEFSRNEDGSIGFDYSIESLEKGDYVLWARTRDRADSYSNSWQQSFNIGNAAPSQLDFNLKQIDGGVELNNTTVFDADGIGDLERIDFQLKQDDGEWIEIQDALDFNQNQDGSISFDYSINSLQLGDYQLRATAYDKAGASGDALTTFFKVNNAAPTDLQFDIEAIEDGVRVTNTKVFDANGMDDLSRVDFWLKKDDESWENIADAVEFRSNDRWFIQL